MNRSKMMFSAIAIATLLVGAAGTLWATEGSGWFDNANCAMCSNITAEKGLMEHMKLENYKVATGMMSVTIVEPAYAEAWARAETKMSAMGDRLMKGEKMTLCGCCQDITDMMSAGAKMDNLHTGAGSVMMVTSTDPALIGRLQAHADRTNAEMAKMMKPMEGQSH
jgi:hypothetical protein